MIIFILRVFVGLLVRFSPFSACIRQCPAILLLIVCPYTSLHCVSVSFSLWISVLVLGYMSLIVRVYMYVSWSVWLSHFLSMNTSICVRLCSHWLYVYRYLSASKFLSVSMSWYIIGKPACIRTSLDWYFFVSLCLCMCEAVSDYIIAHCRCKSVYISWFVLLTLFFVGRFLSVVGYIVSDCRCIGTSLHPRFSLFLCVCLSVRVYYL